MLRILVPLMLVFASSMLAKDDQAVFKTDVALTRVDAQVMDRDGRAVTGLQVDDFILRVDGRVLPIRNFASENMPIDIVLLLDVSGSMEPHVERIALAAREALNVLADRDRVAIMAFDTSTRIRLPFRSSHGEVTGELDRLVRSERFDGGTRITHALLNAADYVRREARPDARRAIVILTDDETQDEEDEARVEAALTRANAVLSFLQAPYEVPSVYGGRRPRGTWGGGSGGWPGGGGVGFPGGGPIILGRGGRGGYGGVDRSHSAGTASIASDSGGDTMRVDEASALQDTLARLRQRYALHFYLPEGSKLGDQSTVQVDLSREARLRYQNAEVRYRRVYILGSGSGAGPGSRVITRSQQPTETREQPTVSVDDSMPKRRRVAVDEDLGPHVNTVNQGDDRTSQPADSSAAQTVQQPSPAPQPNKQAPRSGGWPRVDQHSPKAN